MVSYFKRNSVLAVGPSNVPVTGQSYAFDTIVEALPEAKVIYNSPSPKHQPLLFYLIYWFRIAHLLFKPAKVCYFTCSRTLAGFLMRDLPLIFVCSARGTRVVNHLHGADFQDFRTSSPRLLRKLIDYTYNKVGCTIVLFKSMSDTFECYPNMDTVTIPNFFKREHVTQEQVEAKIHSVSDCASFRILYLSNLMKEKGVRELCEAVIDYASKGYEVELTIAGNIMCSCLELERLINESSSIRYVGVVEGREKENLLLNADVVCLPTYYPTEAQPICLIEGMGFGNAIISTHHNFIPEMIPEAAGVLVEPRDKHDLLEAIAALDSDREKLKKLQKHNFFNESEKYSRARYVGSVKLVLCEGQND